MVDPILSTGLATDWIKRLHKLWSTLRRTREQELQEIRNVFGDPELLARFYIEPDCQPVNPADHNEDEAIRAFRQPVRDWLNRFLAGEFFERDGRNTVFILSDAGMGKSSLLMMLKLTHLLRFWPDGLDFLLLKLGPETLEKLSRVENRHKTVLLLDSLDEDPSAWGRIEERLKEILEAGMSFRQVILTCRTQYFPEGGAAPVESAFKVVVGGYICNLLYLSPFDNAQVEAYLRKVFPDNWRDRLRGENLRLTKARKVVEPMRSLRMRPMLLAHIEDFLKSDVQEWSEFPVYSALVRHWLLREQRKQGKYTESQLWEVCEEVAVHLQRSGKRVLSLADLDAIRQTLPAAESLETFDIGGRSLLNRTSDKGFRFSHYSIQEFLVARRLSSPRWRRIAIPLRATDQLLAFLFSWVREDPSRRLAKVPWMALDFSDVRKDHFAAPGGAKIKSEILLKGQNTHPWEAVFARPERDAASRLSIVRELLWTSRGLLVIGDKAGLWTPEGRLSTRFQAPTDIRGLILSPGGREVLIHGGRDLERWDLESLAVADKRKLERTGELSIGLYQDRGVFIAESQGRQLFIYQIEGRPETPPLPYEYPVQCTAWHPHRRLLASGAADGMIRLHDLSTNRVKLLKNLSAPAVSLSWHPTHDFLAASLRDGSMCIWNSEGNFVFAPERIFPSVMMAWSSDLWLALLSPSGEVVLWRTDVPSVDLPVRASTFSWHPREGLLAVATLQGAIEIWKAGEIPHPLLSLFETPPVEGLVITADNFIDGPNNALNAVRFGGEPTMKCLSDRPQRHDLKRVRRVMAILGP